MSPPTRLAPCFTVQWKLNGLIKERYGQVNNDVLPSLSTTRSMLSQDEVATLIKSTRDEMVLSYLQNAALALLIYDYFLVFSKEIEQLWKRPNKLPALLYFLARYGGLSSFVVPIAVGVGTSNCTGIMRFAGSSFAISQVAMNGYMVVRVFALNHQNMWVLAVLCVFGIAPLVPEIWTVATYVCSTTELSRSHYLKNVYAHVLTLVFETLVLAFSLWRLIPIVRREHGVADALWSFLFADSISSYILVVLFNLLFALMYYLSDPVLITVEAELSQPISIILISHFLLDLRGVLRHEQPGPKTQTNSLELQKFSTGEGSDEVKRTTSSLDEESRGQNNADGAIVPRSFVLGSIKNTHSEQSFTTAVDITNAVPPGFSVSSLSLKSAEELDSGDGPSEFAMHPVPAVDVEGCFKGSGMNFKTAICHNRSQTSHQTDDQPRPVTVIDLADAFLPKRAVGAQETNVLDRMASGANTNNQFRTTTIIDLADAFPPNDARGAHGTDVLDHAASDRPPSVDSEVDLADVHAYSFDEDETSAEDDMLLRTGRAHNVKRRFSLAWKPW